MNDLQFVIKTGATGRQDITERVGDYQLRTRVPGGFWDARIEVASPERDAWLLFDSWPDGNLMVRGVGEVVWQGDLVAPRMGSGRIRMTARGQALRMRGRERWEVYADAGYARWYPVESEKFDLDNNNRVWVASRQNIEYSTWEFGEVRYPESGTVLGANIARVQATVEVAIESGTWRAGFISEIGQPWLWSTTSAGTYQVDFTCDVEGLSFILIALADGEGVATARATQVIIRTMNPTYGESIIADLLGDNGLEVLQLQETGLALDNALWQGDHDFAVIEDVAAFGDGQETWVFALYEDGAEYRPWGSTANWLILPEDVERWTIQEDRDDVRNAVRARLPDGWLSDWQTDADSIGLYGRREETLDVPMTTRDEATKWAQIYLAERKRAITGVQAEPGAWIHKPDGTRWPAYLVRAGDVVVIRDVVPGTDITIRVEETEVSPRGLQIVPMGGPGRLEVIWAAQARQMQRQVEILAADVTMLKSLNLAQVNGGGGAVGVDHGGLSGRDAANQHPASAISTDTTNFDGILSGADTDVQTALETVDDHGHPLADLTGASVGALITGQAGPVWASLAHPGAANRVLLSGATTPEWSAYTLVGYSSRTYTLPDADLTVTGGGTLALGGYTLTVPATGTAAVGAGTLSVSTTNDVSGSSHTHEVTTSSNPGAAASILASDANGYLRLVRLGIGTAPSVELDVAGSGAFSGVVTLSGTGTSGRIKFGGTAGGGDEGITYLDSGSSQRFGLFFPGSDLVCLGNRASNGVVELRANTATAGDGGEVTMVHVEDVGVNIGSSATPACMLEVTDATPYFRLTDSTEGTWDFGDVFSCVEFYTSDTSSYGPDVGAFIRAAHVRSGSGHTVADMGIEFGWNSGDTNNPASVGMVLGNSWRVGIGSIFSTIEPAARLNVYQSGESATQTDFTQAVNKAGILVYTDYTASTYTPGIFWATQDDNAGRPKAGIYMYQAAAGTYLYFGTSDTYATGITDHPIIIDYQGYVGLHSTIPSYELHIDDFSIRNTATGTVSVYHAPTSGNVNIDVDPAPGDGSSNASVRLFRGTNTTGSVILDLLRGDGSTTVVHRITCHPSSTTVFNEQGYDIDFRIEGTSATALFKCDAGNDRVGIRVGSPAAQLDIDQPDGSAAIPALKLDQGDYSEQCILFSSDGVDRDIYLFQVDVTGSPKMWWSESTEQFDLNYGLRVDTSSSIGAAALSVFQNNTAVPGVAVTALYQGDADQPFIDFQGGTIYTGKSAEDEYLMVLNPNGYTRYIKLYS